MLTRRALMVRSTAAVLPVMLPLRALARPDPEVDLRARLAALRFPFAPAEVELLEATWRVDDDANATDQAHRVRALIRLTWSPGVRQQFFSGTGATAEAAISDLTSRVYRTFTKAAGPIREVIA